MTPRERAIRVLIFILSNPYRYSRKEIAKKMDITLDELKGDIKEIKLADVNFDQEKKGKFPCAILPDDQFNELKYLQPLNDEDWTRIEGAFRGWSTKEELYLRKKLESLYDVQKLGLNALRRPALDRLNKLEYGKKHELQVILEKYRSNSNDIRDRQVEVFKIDPELDTLQAFDPIAKKIKHFKLSRIDRVIVSDVSWNYKNKHDPKPTDVFRIAMANQKLVELNIDVYAYNSLIDNYPKAKGECDTGSEPNTFYFQAKVNPLFLGLINFIMNNAGHVEIISPPELKEKVRERINILLKDLDK